MAGKSKSAAEYVNPNSLVPWEDNPRVNEKSIEPVMQSIKRFGFASPIVARKDDKMVIAGHTRLAAAMKLGLKQVPVRFLDITMDEAKALALADNKLGELAMWDNPTLSRILTDLNANAVTIDDLGFDNSALDDLIDNAESMFDLGFGDDDEATDFADNPQFDDTTGVVFMLTTDAMRGNDPHLKAEVVAFAEQHGFKFKVQFK